MKVYMASRLTVFYLYPWTESTAASHGPADCLTKSNIDVTSNRWNEIIIFT
jgi:hypothetical protein